MNKTTLLLLIFIINHSSFSQSNIDVFTENSTIELVQDRLNCIASEMPLNLTKKTYSFINYFTIKKRDYTREVIRKSTIYFPIIEFYLKKYDLPNELKYLSIVESGLNSMAFSKAGAAGLWQFMPSTGNMYGLYQNWYIDERYNPYKATQAACKYLKSLYAMFGDWELALAAYNSGPGNVRKAIRKSGYKKSFGEIYRYLPRETRSYVPQFIAITYAFYYAEEYNLLPNDPAYFLPNDTLLVKGYVNLKTLAKELSICYSDIKNLNTNIKRFAIQTTRKAYPIRLPINKINDARNNRDTLLYLASLYGKEKLRAMKQHYTVSSTSGKKKYNYTIKSGDVLGTIAERYNVRVSDLKKWNGLRNSRIQAGKKLIIWTSSTAASYRVPTTINNKNIHIVQPGDTLWGIARMYKNLDVKKLKTLNKLKSDKLKPNQILVVG